MGIPSGHTVVSIVVPIEVRDELRRVADVRCISVTKMLGDWLRSGIDAPIERAGKIQRVRREKSDELFVSLPRDWMRRCGIGRGSSVEISYSDDALIIRPK